MNQEITSFTHKQPVASDTWVIKHNLNCKPVVQVFVMVDGKLQRIIPKGIKCDTQMQVTVSFTAPFAGHAVLH